MTSRPSGVKCGLSRWLWRRRAVWARALHLSGRWFDTQVPEAALAALDAVDAQSEEPARYLACSVGNLVTLVSDLWPLPTWSMRARLLYEHAFPPADYMLRSYRTSRRTCCRRSTFTGW